MWNLLVKGILYFTHAKARKVQDVPIGFDYQDVTMASQASRQDEQLVRQFLAPSDQNEEREYQIGIAFVGGDDGSSIRLGHAEIILRDGVGLKNIDPPKNLDLTTLPATFAPDELIRKGRGELSQIQNIRLRVLHLRNADARDSSLELALEEKKRVQHYGYVDLYRIRTTERRLKHIALISCPKEYVLLVDDCATFARNFLTGLLDSLRDCGIPDEQLKPQAALLAQHIHIEEGWKGRGESLAGNPGPPESEDYSDDDPDESQNLQGQTSSTEDAASSYSSQEDHQPSRREPVLNKLSDSNIDYILTISSSDSIFTSRGTVHGGSRRVEFSFDPPRTGQVHVELNLDLAEAPLRQTTPRPYNTNRRRHQAKPTKRHPRKTSCRMR